MTVVCTENDGSAHLVDHQQTNIFKLSWQVLSLKTFFGSYLNFKWMMRQSVVQSEQLKSCASKTEILISICSYCC